VLQHHLPALAGQVRRNAETAPDKLTAFGVRVGMPALKLIPRETIRCICSDRLPPNTAAAPRS
jgi:hypothetical protein